MKEQKAKLNLFVREVGLIQVTEDRDCFFTKYWNEDSDHVAVTKKISYFQFGLPSEYKTIYIRKEDIITIEPC